jgi:hypothetical protein
MNAKYFRKKPGIQPLIAPAEEARNSLTSE